MESPKIPKFDWGRIDEPNGGHTKNEWGKIERTPTIIPLYRVKWEKE